MFQKELYSDFEKFVLKGVQTIDRSGWLDLISKPEICDDWRFWERSVRKRSWPNRTILEFPSKDWVQIRTSRIKVLATLTPGKGGTSNLTRMGDLESRNGCSNQKFLPLQGNERRRFRPQPLTLFCKLPPSRIKHQYRSYVQWPQN
jgi:hypothetical protein